MHEISTYNSKRKLVTLRVSRRGPWRLRGLKTCWHGCLGHVRRAWKCYQKKQIWIRKYEKPQAENTKHVHQNSWKIIEILLRILPERWFGSAKIVKSRLRGALACQKWCQGMPKGPEGGPKGGPRRPQERPRRPQGGPKSHKEAPRGGFWSILVIRKLFFFLRIPLMFKLVFQWQF